MGMKDIFKLSGTIFTQVCACIVVAMAFLGSYLASARYWLDYSVFGEILILALLSACLSILFYSREELRGKQMAVRVAIHFAATFALCFTLVAVVYKWTDITKLSHNLILTAAIIVIYGLVNLMQYFQAVIVADQLNTNIRRGLRLRGKTGPPTRQRRK